VGGFGTRLGSARTSRIYRRPSISICVRRSGCWIDRRELTLSMGCSGYVADASYVMLIRASGGQLKVFGITCSLELTWTTCGSSGTDGTSSASLVDLMPGSGVYWGPVYSGIFSNISRYDCLFSEKRLTWYGWGAWIVVHRWKSLVTRWAWLFVDQHCTWGWKNGFTVKGSLLEEILCCRIVLKCICKVLFNYLAHLDSIR